MKELFSTLIITTLFNFCHSFSATAQTWSWQQVPSPNPDQYDNFLRDISAVSANEIWAVGSFSTSPPMSQYISENLIIKWDGSSWTIYPVENPGLTMHNLYDVEVIDSNNIWAVGEYASGGAAKPQLLHYDGNSWSHIDIPNIPNTARLDDIHAISADDIWAVGTRSGLPVGLAYALHYDGTSWTEISVPPVGQFLNHFQAVHGISSNDVWAVGYYMMESWGYFRYMAMHWDGSSWTNSPLPAQYDTILADFDDVVVFASDDVWALGNLQLAGKTFLHWDGSSWIEETPPAGGLALEGSGPNDIYSFGSDINHWDGNSWSLEDSISGIDYPSLSSATFLPNGEIWAAGRSMDDPGNIYTLVYRYAPDSTGEGTDLTPPVYSAASFNNIIGESFTLNLGTYQDPGDAGANVIWDYSSLVTESTSTSAIVNPASTPYANDYPEATFTATSEEGGTTKYLYYKHDNSGLYSLGMEVPGAINKVYSDPRQDFATPFTYSDTYTDANAFITDVFNGSPEDSEGELVVEADGYGTLILPDQTYNNVLRLHSVETVESTFDSGDGTTTSYTTILDSYIWVLEGFPLPFFTVFEMRLDGQLQSSGSSYYSETALSVASHAELKGIEVYPNPVINNLILDMGSNSYENLMVEFIDVKGSIVMKYSSSSLSGRLSTFDLSTLESGAYILRIGNSEGSTMKKIIR